MPKLAMIGPGYQGRSTNLDASRCVNLYPVLATEDAKNVSALVGTPGTALWTDTAAGVIRGIHVFNSLTYVVAGEKLYSIASDGTVSAQIGEDLTTNTGRVQMSDNGIYPTGGNELIIVDGENTYVYNVSTTIWLESTLPTHSGGWVGVCWNGSVFCAMSATSDESITSADGKTWTLHTTVASDAGGWKDCAWNGVVFCAISAKFNGTVGATSPDGAVWTAVTLPAAGADTWWNAIAAKGSVFAIITRSDAGTTAAYSTAVDGSAWSASTLPSSEDWIALCSNGAVFCAVANGSTAAAISTNGQTWSASTLPSSSAWVAVGALGTTLCAITGGTVAATSTNNGTSWTARTLPAGDWGSVLGSSNLFVIVSNTASSTIATSQDGITWTTATLSKSDTYGYKNIAFNDYFFVLVGDTYSFVSIYEANYNGTNWMQVTPAIAANTVAFIGGYFVVDVGSGSFQVSDLYNGAVWNALNKATAEASPDDLLAVFANHGELWLFGEKSTEIFYQSGAGNPPFARVSGGVLDYGCAARHSIAKGNNTIFWLATKRNGDDGELCGVAMASGYGVQLISTDPINYIIGRLSTYSDAFAYCYTEEGHEFYVLTFPAGNLTLVYDITTGLWHERSANYGSTYATGRHIGNCYAYFNGKHYIGSYIDGKIYEMSSQYYTDDGTAINSFRTFPYLVDKNDLNGIRISKFQIDAELQKPLLVAVANDVASTSNDWKTWTSRTMPRGDYKAVAWNDLLFCAVGNGVAATSPDGITWTTRTIPAGDWQSIAWNGTVFCATAFNSAIAATSPNGITWTQRTLPASLNWLGIAWNGSVFCATASGTKCATSPNGITWTERTMPVTGDWYSIAWNGKVFCAVATGSTNAATSLDGVTWTQRTLPASANWRGIASNGRVFCVFTTDGTYSANSYNDGENWGLTALPVFASYYTWYSITWNGSVFCAVAHDASIAATSPDGITWTQRVLSVSAEWLGIAARGNWQEFLVSWSDDGGNSFTADHAIQASNYSGTIRRATLWRCGMTHGRIWRVATVDAAPKVLIGAYINGEGGNS